MECPCIVEFKNVTKRFGGFTVIRDVTFAVQDRPADPADPENHAKNRRVEIKVYPAEATAAPR